MQMIDKSCVRYANTVKPLTDAVVEKYRLEKIMRICLFSVKRKAETTCIVAHRLQCALHEKLPK